MKRLEQSDAVRHVLAPVRHPVGGISSFIRYVYSTLLDAGYRFTFVGPAHSLFHGFSRELGHWPGVEFHEAPLRKGKWQARGVMRSLLRSRRFDLIHSHGLTAGIDAAIANLGIGVPHVLSSHGIVSPRDFTGAAGVVRRFIMGNLLRRVDKVVAEGNDARQNHIDHFPCLRRPGRVATIVNGIVLPPLDGSQPSDGGRLRDQLGLSGETLLVGFFGRFMPEKGFTVLVDAIQNLADRGSSRPLHVVTTGADDYLVNYQRDLAHRPDVNCRVTFLGQLPDIVPVLRQVDLVVMPSLWEACPLLPMEAMTLGVPVLGSDCVGLREVLAGTPSVMVPANNASALADGICRAMESPWKSEAVDYILKARERFDVRHTAAQLLELFDNLIGGPGQIKH
jgi:glycosyltransferase involved in cell wall biosynthesis